MNIFTKNRSVTLWLSLYYAWWLFVASYFLFSTTPPANLLGSPLIIASIFLVLLYSATMIIQIIKTPEPGKTDFMIMLGIVKLPAVIGFIFLVLNA